MNQRHPSWYGLLVRPQFESLVAASLSRKDLEVFLPKYTNPPHLKRRRRIELLLFPGYVLCQTQRSEVASLLTVPGVVHIIGMGTGQNPIDEQEINAIRRVTQIGLRCRPSAFPLTGRRVRISEGPLQDLEGFLAENAGRVSIVIRISALRRAVAVDLGKSVQVVSLLHERTSMMSAPARVS